ncbi:hypothetical protein MRX96_023098 [Rhipicephalus microplus]
MQRSMSREWSLVSPEEREAIGLTFDADGEFWMSERDFMREFHFLEICNLGPDSLDQEVLSDTSKKKWEVSVFEGSWVRGATAGGCRNYLDTFWVNPQRTDGQPELWGAGLFLTIGFALYRIDDPDNCPTPLDLTFFKFHPSAARSHTFINSREVTTRFNLPPGTYCVVPSTFEPNQTGEFLLRIFTEKRNISHEHDVPPAIIPPADNVRAKEEDPSSDREPNGHCCIVLPGRTVTTTRFGLSSFLWMCAEAWWRSWTMTIQAKLGLDEFRALWILVRTWKNVFTAFDKDGSGYLNTFELRAALNSAGYQVNQHILKALVLRYGNDDGNIAFEDFIGCAVKLRTMIEVFKEKDTRNIGSAVFTIDEWLENTMYA